MSITNCTVDMVLTSIVNNPSILSKITEVIKDRYKMDLDEKKLEAFLNTVEIEVKQNVTIV